ncbi:hypothetical protein [Phytoactinopolyspora halotolerans]|uniref:Uncharacterized protein n=1 Tax=Phytoactinopolyspora halotolerans TaxID=1981512 RepID=A0A6L9SEC4_9ACTN|nr:hypothetical protein [Phytoactinopolyspora halotolerans]NEE02908.1 hypothetical protein [Phytoactinopolyspora halotolerans]
MTWEVAVETRRFGDHVMYLDLDRGVGLFVESASHWGDAHVDAWDDALEWIVHNGWDILENETKTDLLRVGYTEDERAAYPLSARPWSDIDVSTLVPLANEIGVILMETHLPIPADGDL